MNPTLRIVLLVVLILLLIGALPMWGYSIGFGYAPVSLVGVLLVVLFVLMLTGHV